MYSMDPHFDGVIFKTHAAEVRRRLSRAFPPFCLLDVRPRDAYEKGHIPGALFAGASDLEAGFPAGTPLRTEFIVVGATPEDPAMRAASLALRRHGAHRVVELTGGMTEWEAAGNPVEGGAGRKAA
jgi:rhodanese-related sulfurtransferase